DALHIDALAVIGNVDRDLTGFVGGRDADFARFWFALGDALFRLLDAVIGTVANEVRQGIADDLDELAVELRICTFGHEVDALAKARRKLTNEAREVGVKAAHRLHA